MVRSPLLLVAFLAPTLAQFCLIATGELPDGFAVENRMCIPTAASTFFYGIRAGPISSNGLQAGAPTDLHLLFGSPGKSIEDAFDPENYGMAIPPGGKMVMDFSKHFVTTGQAPTVELGLAPGNPLIGGESCATRSDVNAEVVCANFDVTVGSHPRQLVVTPRDPTGLTGARATEVGFKFAHIHPELRTDEIRTVFYNANGVCDNVEGEVTYCVNSDHCPGFSICVPQRLIASVTVTIFDSETNTVYKGKRDVVFSQEAGYSIASFNGGLTSNQEVAETVDFQRVPIGSVCSAVSRPSGTLFSEGGPYAPRFILFPPNEADTAFPHPSIANLLLTRQQTSGSIFVDGQRVGIFDLIQPEGAFGTFVDENISFTLVDSTVGGTIFAIPVQVAGEGRYTVKVTMINGVTAESNIIASVPTPAPSAAPTISSQPSMAPITPTLSPTISSQPTGSPSESPSSVPTVPPPTMAPTTAAPTRTPSR